MRLKELTPIGVQFKTMEALCKVFKNEVLEGNSSDVYIPTGFKMLDDREAFQLSDMWVIAADSSQDMTSFAAAVALHATKSGVPTAFYSMEMTANQLFARIMATRIGVPNEIITKRPLTDDLYQRAINEVAKLESLPMYFGDGSASSVDDIISSIRTMHEKGGVKLVVVDYMQMFNTKSANGEQALANAARKFKYIAKELNICVIILSQLSRERNESKPKLSEIRGSGQITEAADGVILIWRPEYYGSHLNYPQPFADVSTHNTALIEVAKGRNVGCMSFIAGFKPEQAMFYDLKQDEEQPEENELTLKGAVEIQTCDDTQLTVQLAKQETIGKGYSRNENVVCLSLKTDTGSGNDGSQSTSLTVEQLRKFVNTLTVMLHNLE